MFVSSHLLSDPSSEIFYLMSSSSIFFERFKFLFFFIFFKKFEKMKLFLVAFKFENILMVFACHFVCFDFLFYFTVK